MYRPVLLTVPVLVLCSLVTPLVSETTDTVTACDAFERFDEALEGAIEPAILINESRVDSASECFAQCCSLEEGKRGVLT